MRRQKYKKTSHFPNDSPFFVVSIYRMPYPQILFCNSYAIQNDQFDNILANYSYRYRSVSYTHLDVYKRQFPVRVT